MGELLPGAPRTGPRNHSGPSNHMTEPGHAAYARYSGTLTRRG